MTRVRDAMIVAGGAGSRLWPLTRDTPKPLLEFCGAPFLAGVVRRLAAVGVRRIQLVVGADPAPFAVLDATAARAGVQLSVVAEPEPLDTAGGVRSAIDRVGGPFFVLNGDVLTDLDLDALATAHHDAAASATLALTRVEDPSGFGVCVTDGTRITAFVEKPAHGEAVGHDTVNAGTYVLEPSVLTRFPTGRLSFERDVFPAVVAAGDHVEGFVSSGAWADLGTPQRFLAGQRLVLDGALRWPTLEDFTHPRRGLWCGADVEVDPAASIAVPCVLGDGVRVGAGARVGPYAVVGPRGRIGDGAVVRDSAIGGSAVVGDGAVVERALVGPRAHVGARAGLDGYSVVAAGEWVAAGVRLTPGRTLPVPGGQRGR